jgi:ABC-type branched-subunit amino acid transport system substrate-binding protein
MAFSPPSRQARRDFLITLLGASLLAGCQTGRRPPLGESGAPVVVRPVDAQRNLVALVVPLTGADAGVGSSLANAANLALTDTGEKSLRLNIYDSAGPGGAAAATQRAVAEGAGLILGPLLAADVRAAAPVARRASVPVIAFSNDESVAGDGVYLIGLSPTQSIARVVGFAREKGAVRFAGLIPSGLYGERASQALNRAVRSAGGRVTALENFSRSPASARAAAGRLRVKGGFDAVLIADGGQTAAVAAPVLPGAAKLLGTELWANDKQLGKTAALRGAWYAAAPDTRFAQLASRYRARYGKSPYRLASLAYDSVLLAARAAKAWPIGRPFPARTLGDREGFVGVDGTFRFGRDGVADRLLEVRQVTGAGTSVVARAGTAF